MTNSSWADYKPPNNWQQPTPVTNPYDAMSRDEILYLRLKELLYYDPNTGIFKWIKTTNSRILINSIAGSANKKGYIRIRFDGKYYLANRLAWLYMTGRWPEKEMVDHKDLNPSNNTWFNLREATRQQNAYNRPADFDNKLGVKGVHIHNGKFLAQINIDGKSRYLGLYDKIKNAKEAYEQVAENIQREFAYKEWL